LKTTTKPWCLAINYQCAQVKHQTRNFQSKNDSLILNSPQKYYATVLDILDIIVNLQQNTVRTQGIHVACLSPAKTRQHHAHPLQSKQVVHPLVNTTTRIQAFLIIMGRNLHTN